MDEAEWMRRYKQRFITVAEMAPDVVDRMVNADGRPFAELAEGFEDDPEGAADEEMSYWEP